MKIYTIESFDGYIFDLVLCTTNEKEVKDALPIDYGKPVLIVKEWIDGKIINSYRKVISIDF